MAAITVGENPTVPVDWSLLTTNRVAMTALRMHRRVATWLRLEPRVDAWTSYAAFGLAAAATLAALASF